MQRNNLSDLFIKYKGNDHEATIDKALRRAAAFGPTGDIKILIASSASLTSQGSDGRTALHWAIAKERADVVEFLISKGAPIHIADKNGETCAQLAAKSKNKELQHIISLNLTKNHSQTYVYSGYNQQVNTNNDYSEQIDSSLANINANGFISEITFSLSCEVQLINDIHIFGAVVILMNEKLEYPLKGTSTRYYYDNKMNLTGATITISVITPHDITIKDEQNRVTLTRLLNESLIELWLKTKNKFIQVGEIQFRSSPSTVKYAFDDRIEYMSMEYEGRNDSPSLIVSNKLNIYGKNYCKHGHCFPEYDSQNRLKSYSYNYTLLENQDSINTVSNSSLIDQINRIIASKPPLFKTEEEKAFSVTQRQLENIEFEIKKLTIKMKENRQFANGYDAVSKLNDMLKQAIDISNSLQNIDHIVLAQLYADKQRKYKKLTKNLAKIVRNLMDDIISYQGIAYANKSTSFNYETMIGNKDITRVIFGFLDNNQKKKTSTVCHTWSMLIKPEITSSQLKMLVDNDLLSIRVAFLLDRFNFDNLESSIKKNIIAEPQKVDVLINEKVSFSLFNSISHNLPFGGIKLLYKNKKDVAKLISLCPSSVEVLRKAHPVIKKAIVSCAGILIDNIRANDLLLEDFFQSENAMSSFASVNSGSKSFRNLPQSYWIDVLIARKKSHKTC